MRKYIFAVILLASAVLLSVSCTAPEAISCPAECDCLQGPDVADGSAYPTHSVAFGENGAEYILLKSSYWFESIPSGTVTVIDSESKLEKFQKKHEVWDGLMQLYTIDNFNGYAKELEDDFFEQKILLAIHIQSGSGSERFYVSNVTREGDKIKVGISGELYPPMTPFTCDMASWHMVVELDRALVEGVNKFEAVSDTRHTRLEGNRSDVYDMPVISLDENSSVYYLSYGKYLGVNHRGKYSLTATELTLFVTEDGENKLVFEKSEDGFVYNEGASVWNADYITPLTFPDGTLFN